MGYFPKFLSGRGLNQHIEEPIWKYNLTEEEFQALKTEIQFSSSYNIDTRDAFLFYAEWWKNYYDGGSPSKKAVFNTLGGNLSLEIDENQFFKYAKNGAIRLGVNWITKQNTLYFKTMLLQGGLPLKHISDNYGKYLDFLLAVLDEQPESVEDFSFKSDIIGILPKSSQNDTIYENCFEIVRSILHGESIYDSLLQSNETIQRISKKLKEKKKTLIRKTRETKPKIYWLLSNCKGIPKIVLRVGLADSYSSGSLSNILGFELGEREYQFYLNDELLCVFRRTLKGNYKTEWWSEGSLEWNGSPNLYDTYILANEKKHTVNDFIQIIPNLKTPSFWVKYSDDEWRLVKSNGTSAAEAAVLFPEEWSSPLESFPMKLYGESNNWHEFEGEVTLSNTERKKTFYSKVDSFDWTIITQKPSWLLMANMPVVQNVPKILLYDEAGKRIQNGEFDIFIRKRKSFDFWKKLNDINRINIGCYDLKIERNGLKAYDVFYNVGNFRIEYLTESLEEAKIKIENTHFTFSIKKDPFYEFEYENSSYSLRRIQEANNVPRSIKASLSEIGKKSLHFEFDSPFKGVAIVDENGEILSTKKTISIHNLSGLRILSKRESETILTIKNILRNEVKIIKTLPSTFQPLINFREVLFHLYYLVNPMDYKNKVIMDLKSGSDIYSYEVIGFTCFLGLDNENENRVKVEGIGAAEIDLVAIPLDVDSERIELIPLLKEVDYYTIPKCEFTSQFIVISSGDRVGELMPRFVHTGEYFIELTAEERIEHYHDQFTKSSFDQEPWKVLYKYCTVCQNQKIPFSTFDQITAISRSPVAAAKALLYLGHKSRDKEGFIQKIVPKLEMELGICFHWIDRKSWEIAIDSVVKFNLEEDWFIQLRQLNLMSEIQLFADFGRLVGDYFKNIELENVLHYVNDEKKSEAAPVSHSRIIKLRSRLGERVLRELPTNIPRINKDYGIPINEHAQVTLLICAPIAVAESISDVQENYPIWGGGESRRIIRRNIQYAHFLAPEYYKDVLTSILQKS